MKTLPIHDTVEPWLSTPEWRPRKWDERENSYTHSNSWRLSQTCVCLLRRLETRRLRTFIMNQNFSKHLSGIKLLMFSTPTASYLKNSIQWTVWAPNLIIQRQYACVHRRQQNFTSRVTPKSLENCVCSLWNTYRGRCSWQLSCVVDYESPLAVFVYPFVYTLQFPKITVKDK